MFEDTFM